MESNSHDWGSSADPSTLETAGLPKWLRATLIAAAMLAVATLAVFLVNKKLGIRDQPATIFVDAPEARPVVARSDGYAGSSACKSCHTSEHSSWHASFHRTMTQVASPQSIVGDFDNVDLTIDDRRFHLRRDNTDFWVEFNNPRYSDAKPGKSEMTRRKVVLCTGSHHMQVYWMSTGRGRELAVLPFVWLIQDQKWTPRRTAFLTPPYRSAETVENLFEAGRWNQICISCHATHGQPGYHGGAPRTTVADFGIACEACHGPGQAHVQLHQGREAGSGIDPIVHPPSLGRERGSEVCGQCHSFSKISDEFKSVGASYRPGKVLSECQLVYVNQDDPGRFWPDGMARVAGREYNGLIESPCYKKGELSCFSCHAMHQPAGDTRSRSEWADDQLKPKMRSDEACLQCHDQYRDQQTLLAHTHHGSSSSGSRCYNCHMPHTSLGLLKAIRSHQVSSPSVQETQTTGRANACNLCHLDKSLKWSGDFLAKWYGHQSLGEEVEGANVAVAVLMALKGDAAVRAIAAWHMGWPPAREVSGDSWMPAYLSILMNHDDEYDAVRIVGQRSLNRIEGFQDIGLALGDSPEQRAEIQKQIETRWDKQMQDLRTSNPSLLISEGKLYRHTIDRFLQERNNQPVQIEE